MDELEDIDTFAIDLFCEAIGVLLCVFAVLASIAGDSMPLMVAAGLGVYGFGSSLVHTVREWVIAR